LWKPSSVGHYRLLGWTGNCSKKIYSNSTFVIGYVNLAVSLHFSWTATS